MAYVAIEVGSDIVYVAGTINGVDTVWEEHEGLWYGYADTARDNLYHFWVEMYDEAGNRSEYEDTLYYEMPWFVTDRTQEDIDNRTEKAYINASDLNRIEKNTYTICGLIDIVVDTKTDWAVGDIPRVADFARILAQVGKMYAFAHYHTTPAPPERPLNTFQKYNDVEQIQKDCFDIYVGNKKNIVYAGEIYAGEGGFI